MEEGKKVVESSSATMMTCHSELRIESSPTAIVFSDSCPCCGNKKRRCLQPATFFRKKLLVLDSANPEPITPSFTPTASLSLPSPRPPFGNLNFDPISPMSPPAPPTTPMLQPPSAASVSPFAALEKSLERSNSTLTEEKGVICTADERKVHLKNGEDVIAQEEVRICVRCHCGIVRRIILFR